MTTFNAIIYAVVHGFAIFLPISAGAHQFVLPFFFNLPEAHAALQSALSMGAIMALLVFFRDDWFSIISSFLQILIFRKKPMTLDERMPFFVLAATVPLAAAWYYMHHEVRFESPSPLFMAGSLAAFSFPLWLGDRLGRKNKKMFDWNWIDAAILGLVQIFSLVPGSGRQATALTAALFRNYSREAAAKFLFFSLLPVLAGELIFNLRSVDFSAAVPTQGMTWLSYIIAVIVTFLAGLLAMGGFMKSIRTRSFGGFVTYRLILASGIVILYLIQNYS